MKNFVFINLLLAFSLLGINKSFAQEVKWLSFDQLNENIRKEPRQILIFIHTDWCKFCMMQENTTFKDKEIIKNLNENFYCLKLNAEDKGPVTFLNRKYQYNSLGYHELAEFLGKENGQLTFPTTVLLSKYLQISNRLVGFLDKKTLNSISTINNP